MAKRAQNATNATATAEAPTGSSLPAGAATAVLPRKRKAPLFLPYGKRWINDKSKRKFKVKSRRIGITWYESFDAVEPRITDQVKHDYLYTGINLDMAREFIDYCAFFQKDVFGKVADKFDDAIEFDFTDAENRTRKLQVNTFNIRFPSGVKIIAMPSRPAALRGRGGDLGIDEMAFHEDQEGLYKAAASVTKWGGRLRMWSSPNGEGTLFSRLDRNCQTLLKSLGIDPLTTPGGSVPFDALTRKATELRLRPVVSYHRTTIVQAVADGLVDILNAVSGTKYTAETFLKECHDECLNDDHYRQEYGCEATTAMLAALGYHIIDVVQHEACGGIVDWPLPVSDAIVGYTGGPVYFGMDVARTVNWSVVWIFELVGDVLWTRGVYRMKGVDMVDQQSVLEQIIGRVKFARGTILKRGVGVGITDHMIRKYSASRISGLDETLPNKVGMITGGVQRFQDRKVRVPAGEEIKEKLHAVREQRTPGGQITYAAPTSDDGSHGDEAMACFAAIDAAAMGGGGLREPLGIELVSPMARWEGL